MEASLSGEQMSEFQREILEDGTVTYAEFERANLEVRACAERQGVQFKDFVYNEATRQFDYLFRGPDESDGDSAAEIHDRCVDELLIDVMFAWISLERPSDDELDVVRPIVVDCLADFGIDVRLDFLVSEIGTLVLTSGIDGAVECLAPLEPWS